MNEYFHVTRNAVHASRLMLSKSFAARYDKMNQRLGEADHQNLMPPKSAEIAARVMRSIVPELEDLTIREFGVAR